MRKEAVKHSTNRIFVTHVGSLVRPPDVVELTRGREPAKPYDQRELEILDRNVKEAVRLQAETGIDIPSDGEYSKSSFSGYVSDRLTGYENRPGVQTFGGSRRGRDRRRFSEAYEVIEGGGGGGGAG